MNHIHRFWLYEPSILLNKNSIKELWPISNYGTNRKLNAITRLILLLTMVGYAYTRSIKILISCVISIFFIVLVFKLKQKDVKEGMTSVRNIIKETTEHTKPKKNNPIMNVLLNEYTDNPNRQSAELSYKPSINKEINTVVENNIKDAVNISENQYDRLFKDLGDNIDFKNSMRQFYTMPNTSIPNKQTDFAKWCYGDMKSRKDGEYIKEIEDNPDYYN